MYDVGTRAAHRMCQHRPRSTPVRTCSLVEVSPCQFLRFSGIGVFYLGMGCVCLSRQSLFHPVSRSRGVKTCLLSNSFHGLWSLSLKAA